MQALNRTDREAGNQNAKFHHLTRIQLDIEASLIGKFLSFLRRCDNKKNQRWPTAAIFFDRLDFGFILARLDIEGNILTNI